METEKGKYKIQTVVIQSTLELANMIRIIVSSLAVADTDSLIFANTEPLKVRLITPGGAIWQRHGDPKAQAETAIGRASTNIGLPAMALWFEEPIFVCFCLFHFVSALVVDNFHIETGT